MNYSPELLLPYTPQDSRHLCVDYWHKCDRICLYGLLVSDRQLSETRAKRSMDIFVLVSSTTGANMLRYHSRSHRLLENHTLRLSSTTAISKYLTGSHGTGDPE